MNAVNSVYGNLTGKIRARIFGKQSYQEKFILENYLDLKATPTMTNKANKTIPLLQVPPGTEVRISSMNALPDAIRSTLQAYGAGAGKEIRVLQHSPETVVEIEATELAFEKGVAEMIMVWEKP